MLIHEITQPLSEPADGDLLGTPPLLQLLDSAVGEVHAQPFRANTASTIAACSAACARALPFAGAELAGLDTSATRRPMSSGRCRAMNGQAPMLAGSSCTHVTCAVAGYFASSAEICSAGSGYSCS